MEQRQAQRVFQLAQVLAHGGGRHAELAGCATEAAGSDHFGEHGHAFELVHI